MSVRLNARLGQQLTLWCNVSGNPAPNVDWYKNGQRLNLNKAVTSSYPTHSYGKNYKTHQCSYHCTHYDSIHYVIASHPLSPVTNTQFGIRNVPNLDGAPNWCGGNSQTSYATHPYDWAHNPAHRQPSFSSNVQSNYFHRLNIKNLRQIDLGQYMCIATNRLGKAKKTIDINIGGMFEHHPNKAYPHLYNHPHSVSFLH